MDDAAAWAADSGRDDQEGSWDGAGWTDEMGPGGMGAELDADFERPAEHVPQLHRAMSEAAADLEAVDDRLSTLFDRTEGPESGAAPRPAAVEERTLHPEFLADDAGCRCC